MSQTHRATEATFGAAWRASRPLLVLLLATAAAAAAAERSVQFIVSAPEQAGAPVPEIYCSFSIDHWPAGGRALPRVAPGLFCASFMLPTDSDIEFKFLRARDWLAVEKDAAGAERPNRAIRLTSSEIDSRVFCTVARWADRPDAVPHSVHFETPRERAAAPASRAMRSTRTGDIRTHAAFESPQLQNRRTVWVYLPPSYEHDVATRYPVLYVHDGQNVFDAATSFQGVEWGLDESAERLIAAGQLPPLIIVAIENTPARRSEYTCVVDARHGGGDGDKYLDFIVKTLKPVIDATYRTRPEREQTAVMGSSLGGLISLHALARRPAVFSRAAAVSPAVFWADRAIVAELEAATLPRPLRLWVDIGTEEGADVASFAKSAADCDDLAAALRRRGWKAESELHYETINGGRHHERDWAARADRILMFLFPQP